MKLKRLRSVTSRQNQISLMPGLAAVLLVVGGRHCPLAGGKITARVSCV